LLSSTLTLSSRPFSCSPTALISCPRLHSPRGGSRWLRRASGKHPCREASPPEEPTHPLCLYLMLLRPFLVLLLPRAAVRMVASPLQPHDLGDRLVYQARYCLPRFARVEVEAGRCPEEVQDHAGLVAVLVVVLWAAFPPRQHVGMCLVGSAYSIHKALRPLVLPPSVVDGFRNFVNQHGHGELLRGAGRDAGLTATPSTRSPPSSHPWAPTRA
jgi:hypothetical protein